MEGTSKFLSKFYKSGSPLNMWQSLVTIDSENKWRKMEEKTQIKIMLLSKKNGWLGQHSWRLGIIMIMVASIRNGFKLRLLKIW